MSFIPEDYKEPQVGKYLKLQNGENKFRIMGDSIVGYEYFNNDNKPVRSKEEPKKTPNIKDGGKVKYFVAFPIWNYDSESIQIAVLTQKSIRSPIFKHAADPDRGSPVGEEWYDIVVDKEWSGMDTEYDVIFKPKKKWSLPQEAIDAYNDETINIENLYVNADPFGEIAEDVDQDLPF